MSRKTKINITLVNKIYNPLKELFTCWSNSTDKNWSETEMELANSREKSLVRRKSPFSSALKIS